jgi:hypothetical protein
MPSKEGGPHDARPFFVIPYWPPAPPGASGDTGQRPLPASATWYLCQGIHASPYQPATDLEVTVDVRNFGGSNAPSLAQVTVWWSDPTTGFVIDPSRMIGFDMVAVPPRGGTARTKPMVEQIPASAPNHICLIARVTHQYDRAGEFVAPANDRHWAQRNIAVLLAPPREPAVLEFVAGNPFPEAAEFDLYVRPLEDVRGLAGEVSGELVSWPALFVVDGRRKFEGAGSFSIALEPEEQRPIRLSIRIDELGREQFAAFTVSQQLGELHVGGLGVAVAAAHDR